MMNISIEMFGCRSCNFKCQYCMGPDKSMDKPFELDEKALKESIEFATKCSSPAKKNDGYYNFIIWGGEPFTHFEEVKKTYDFLVKNFKVNKITISSNGFLLKKKEIQDWVLAKKNVIIQLSVDGLGQKYRSNYNPLDDESTNNFLKKLVPNKNLCVNCVVHQKNWDMFANIDYFTAWMKELGILESDLDIRFTPISESEVTPEFNMHGKELAMYITQLEKLICGGLFGDYACNVKYSHFIRALIGQFTNTRNAITKKTDIQHSCWCNMVKYDVSEYSTYIDTKGKFVCCNLTDSGIEPRGTHHKSTPEYCKGCRFEGCAKCYPCPACDWVDTCEFKFAYNECMDRINKMLDYLKNRIPYVNLNPYAHRYPLLEKKHLLKDYVKQMTATRTVTVADKKEASKLNFDSVEEFKKSIGAN